jgi:aminoglycoside 6'-N-acetyltransferase I
VRRLIEKDIPEWFRLRKQLWDESTNEEHKAEMRDIFEHIETQLVLVAETSNGKLVGFLEASIRPFVEDCHSDHVGYLEGWFVEPDYRQNGIGGKLVRAAESWAQSKGCTEMASGRGNRKRTQLDGASKSGLRRNLAPSASQKGLGMKKSKLKNKSLRILFCILHLAFLTSAISAQSTNQSYPTAITSNEITGRIAARDIGDARLTSYFYVFGGGQGDVFINVQTSNFNGDVDVFTQGNLKP